MPLGLLEIAVSGTHLALAANEIFVGRQFFQTHRPAGVQFIGADSDLRAETKFAAVGEASGGIPVNGRGIDFAQELLCRFLIARDDAVAVMRTKSLDVRDRLVRRIDHPHGKNEVEKLGRPIGLRGGRSGW